MSIQTRQGKGPVTVLGVHWTAKGFPQKVTCEHALQEEQPEGAGREGGRGGDCLPAMCEKAGATWYGQSPGGRRQGDRGVLQVSCKGSKS